MKRYELFSTLIKLREINEEKPKEYLENLYMIENLKISFITMIIIS